MPLREMRNRMNSIGIEIKSDSVVMAYLKTSLRSVKLISHAVYSLEKDKTLKEKLGVVRALFTDFIEEHRIPSATVFIGIPSESVMFRDIEFPLAVKENLRSTLKYEMEKYIPLSPEDICFDYQILSENKEKNRLKLLLIVVKKTVLAPYLDISAVLKGGVCSIEPRSTALANCLGYAKGKSDLGSDILNILKTEPDGERYSMGLSKIGIPSRELFPAFGLGLRGLRKTLLDINLVPEELRKKPGQAGRYLMLALLTLTLLSGIAWGGSHILKQRLIVKELDAEMNRLKSEIINIDRMQESAKALEERLGYLTKLRNERVPVPEILKELTQIVPEKAWIRDFTFSKKGIEIDGYADAASELIPALESSPFFNDVVFLSTITKEQDGKEHFRIGMKIEGMKTEDNE